MLKKISSIIIALLIAMQIFIIGYAADENIKVILNGNELSFDVPPQTINDRTFVPMRTIFEAMGASVEWYDDTQYVIAKKDNIKVAMQINNPVMSKNDNDITLDVSPQIISGKTFVPVRAVAESFNADVQWDGMNNSVKIKSYIFALNDDELWAAKSEGEKGVANVRKIDSSYIIKPSGEYFFTQYSELRVLTPYLYFARASAMKVAKYETYTLEEIKSAYESEFLNGNQVILEMRLPENDYKTQLSMAVSVFQNGNKIEISNLTGTDEFPSRGDNFPDDPAYIRTVTAYLNQSDIDINQPLTVKANYLGTWELIFDVNLRNYK